MGLYYHCIGKYLNIKEALICDTDLQPVDKKKQTGQFPHAVFQ